MLEQMGNEPRSHVLRQALPWRHDEAITECGRQASDCGEVITREKLVWLVKKHGIQRMGFATCNICLNTANNHGESWETHPAALISRDMRRGHQQGTVYFEHQRGGQRNGPYVDQLSAELHAIAHMIAENPEEFAERVESAKEAALFGHRRRQIKSVRK